MLALYSICGHTKVLYATALGDGTKPVSNAKVSNALAKPGTKAFTCNTCFKGHEDPEWQHVYSFCLATINKVFPHSENSCNRRKAQGNANKILMGVMLTTSSPSYIKDLSLCD